ncbi:MAG: hypothetical protein ACRDPR_22320, partial [Nocardioidaceae bacterium]
GGAVWTGGQINGNSSAILNSAAATWDIQVEERIAWGTGSIPTFVNEGTITKTAGTSGEAQIDVNFTNNGTLSVTTGRLDLYNWGTTSTSTGSFTVGTGDELRFESGTYNLAGGSTVTGPGTIRVDGAGVNVGGAFDPATTSVSAGVLNLNTATTLNTVNLSGGTLGGSANMTVTDFAWTGGTLTAPTAATSTTVTGTLQMAGTTKILTGRTFNDDVPPASPTNWTSGNLHMTQGALFNNAGRINIAGDQDVTSDGSGTTIITNEPGATLAKTAGGGGDNTYIDHTLNNEGDVLVQTGFLRLLRGGGHPGPFTIGSSGALQFEGGTHTVGGSIIGADALLNPSGLAATPFDNGGALANGTYYYKV